ncbi:MAG: hypothetical protein COW13_01760 [Candidatus Omnitrophica bacterium CG12_big_fil_rev_8_21_14_0_65_50_5]|nr:MAG: hypothetical protein COW13_01760 [Candidatus Omnitrophica bacterium CG12_big_fil_rev_8_21_14_0_65_50_5]
MRIWLIAFWVLISFGFSSRSVWLLQPVTGHLTRIDRLAGHPRDSRVFYFTSQGGLYKADLAAGQSSLLYTFPSTESSIHSLITAADTIYAAADSGVYAISEDGRGSVIFRASEDERPCAALSAIGETLFVGTSRDVKTRAAGSKSWAVLGGGFHSEPVSRLRSDGTFLYIAAGQKVYRFDPQTGQSQIIFTSASSHVEPEESDSDSPVMNSASSIKDLWVSRQKILIADSSGIFESRVDGQERRLIAAAQLLPAQIHALTVAGESAPVMAATDQGVFYLTDGHWQALRDGMESVAVYDLISMSDGSILAAAQRGIFILSDEKTLAQDAPWPPVFPDFSAEPAIRDVQSLAVHYAEVHPDKISNWRKQARFRAILPDLSIGLDRDAGEFWHWDTGPNPDQLTQGRELVDWGVSVSWDLGDLIWSSDQTSIDSRSKLMVELREDILNQVTRIYFERRRLQYELVRVSDELQKFDTDLKIQEMTALLDGFTGGKFSAAIGKK